MNLGEIFRNIQSNFAIIKNEAKSGGIKSYNEFLSSVENDENGVVEITVLAGRLGSFNPFDYDPIKIWYLYESPTIRKVYIEQFKKQVKDKNATIIIPREDYFLGLTELSKLMSPSNFIRLDQGDMDTVTGILTGNTALTEIKKKCPLVTGKIGIHGLTSLLGDEDLKKALALAKRLNLTSLPHTNKSPLYP
jgi:hypothetical protein